MAITKYDDVIDSREVIERIEELQAERDEHDDPESDNATTWADEYPEDAAELAELESLAAEAECSPDWSHGETLVRYDHFRDYVQELAEDCGMVPDDLKWPLSCIDWEQAARELSYDYMTVYFGDVDYLIRS